ncbi:MAG: branched-chain amino acid ABC transporter permease [Hyphomicrobiales bacterium]|nr:MAG: branched-chain amino acid ABC transporter permease [Hyphomicrobiales bacterium]
MRRRIFPLIGLAVFMMLPPLATWIGEPYLVSTFTRIVIFAIAAVTLDLLIGFGGMVSFGHAAFFGLGAYVSGIIAHHAAEQITLFGLPATDQALIIWPLAILVSAAAALVIGFLSLRTSGVHFIMITLAFAQMLYFLFVSMEKYGGDDGLMMLERNPLPGLDMSDDWSFYYLCLGLLAVVLFILGRLINARFGMVLRSIKQSGPRARSLGISSLAYRLTAFCIAGAGAGLAGALMANHNGFVSPALLHWTLSGDILIMVVLGGIGTLYGPVLGAVIFLALEEFLPLAFEGAGLPGFKEHWRVVFGPLLIVIVLFAKSGLYGFLLGKEAADV